MATRFSISQSTIPKTSILPQNPFLGPQSFRPISSSYLFSQATIQPQQMIFPATKTINSTICLTMEEKQQGILITEEAINNPRLSSAEYMIQIQSRAAKKFERKRSRGYIYLVAAVLSMAVAAVFYRFSWQMQGREVPVSEMLGASALCVGAAMGTEFWAGWAHKSLWHGPSWYVHKSHHRPRKGSFELNDVFGILNALPAILLLSFGLNCGIFPSLCFGAGLGITVSGMVYIFLHDGMVHNRFLVGPISQVPYFQKIAAAHQIHHSGKFKGVPFGFILGAKELEEEEGGLEELEIEIYRRFHVSKTRD